MVVARFDFTEYVEKVKHKNQIHRHCISKFSAKKLRFCDTLTFSIHKTKKNKKTKKKHRKVNYTSFTLLDSLLKRDLEFEMRAFLALLGLGFERVTSDLDFGFE